MKAILFALLVALLMIGCGSEDEKEDLNDTENNPSVLPPFVEEWTKWEGNPKPYGGLKILAKIKEAAESNSTSLSLGVDFIADVSPLKGLTSLEFLWLNYNTISDISPLKGLTKLNELALDGNQISDISPLKELTKLKTLHLDENQIFDISPLEGLSELKTLYLGRNQILEAQKAMLRRALPNCKITF